MNQQWMENAEVRGRKKQRKKLWHKIVGVLSCIVVFCTTYALILPAITMEQTAYCGYEAHVHDDSCLAQETVLACTEEETPEAHSHGEGCYETQQVLTCGQEEQEPHVHGEDCYSEQECYVCGQVESEGHIHGDDCFRDEQTLVCQEPEADAHFHDESCYTEQVLTCQQEQTEGHTHGEDCYEMTRTLICVTEEQEGHTHWEACVGTQLVLSCGLEETEGHVHSEDCREIQNVLVCQIEAAEGHVHTEACYETVQPDESYICALEEHEHALACYSDPTADVESASVWEATLPEKSGVWAQDVLAIAESQLGYTESTKNYIVLEDGETSRGYTRYGEWYGDAYGDWCAMFASFCIHYAQVEYFPLEASCSAWITDLEEQGDYITVEEGTPDPGDLVFFDKDGDGSADHVGIVTAFENGSLEAIEGNAGDQVARKSYDGSDETILGYGLLPYQLTQEERSQVDEVIALIDAMPSADEIDAELAAYESADDMEGEEAYYTEVSQQVAYVYYRYSRLSDSQKEHVTNADKLMELEYIWSVTVLADVDTVDVYAVNSYWYEPNCGSLIVYSDSGRTIGEMGMSESDFNWWYAVIVEPVNGQMVVQQLYLPGEGVSKSALSASSSGFILLFHPGTLGVTVDISVGDYVAVSSDFWKNTGSDAYTGTSLGTVTFQDTPVLFKPEKDNTSKLTIVESADTSELIQVNLYDYDSTINTLYTSNTKYPGFQQDSGTLTLTDSTVNFDGSSFNFGNNITSDLAAGIESLTNKGGTINQTVSSYNGADYGLANLPVEGAMSKTLVNGYPAMADGTSLNYLFSQSTYADKQNTANINGLFRYNAVTGAYTFNSRENHAQFDPATNTFTLYKQIISSNFMMYPFGNFLPFNDITKLSAQASTIDRTYLVEIAQSAEHKYQYGAGEEYHTLYEQLTEFIELMDYHYGSDWDAYDATNAYFAARSLPATFSETSPTLDDGTPVMDAVYSIDYDEPTDFFFGMEMKMSFYQPRGGKTGLNYDQDMVFYFTGDDDVWVYVDGAMFLDLTGIHRHVGGKIDFVEGKIYYYGLDIATGDVSTTAYKTVTFEEAFRAAYAEGSAELTAALDTLNEKGTFKDYTSHTFNFYYTERGAGSGVCRMNFNFPLLRQNTIQVEKELTLDSDVTVLGDPDYPFQIIKAGEDGTDVSDLFITAGTPYTLYDRDGTVIQEVRLNYNPDGSVSSIYVVDGNGNTLSEESWITTDANGVFCLKAGQKAEFVGISETAGSYFVRELLSEITLPQYGQITVSGTAATTGNQQIIIGSETFTGADSPVKDMADGSTAFCFENEVSTTKLGSLSISKDLINHIPSDETQYFDIEVTLDGAPLPVGTAYTVDGEQRTVETEGIITIAADETAVLSNILSGTAFTVRETSGSAEGYTVTYTAENAEVEYAETGVEGLIRVKADVKITVTNAGTGTSVTIPGTKTLLIPDGEAHTFTFRLSEVTDQTGAELKEDGIANHTASVTLTDSVQNFAFTINYATDPEQLPQTFYYRVTEDASEDTAVNDTVYIVQVTVSIDGDGVLSADVTGLWKGRMVGGVPAELESCDGSRLDFVNALSGELSLEKTVDGGDEALAGAFDFTITLQPGSSGLEALPESYRVTLYQLDGTSVEKELTRDSSGQIRLTGLKHGERAVIHGIPVGAAWTIEETSTEGFVVYTEVTAGETTSSGTGATTTGTITGGSTAVTYTNQQTYLLPETGGTGTFLYTAGGLLTMSLAAMLLMYSHRKRRKEDHASS